MEKYIEFSPSRIAIAYLVIAAVWLFLFNFRSYDSWLFVAFTASAIYLLFREYEKQFNIQKFEQDELLKFISREHELLGILMDRIPVMVTIYDPGLDVIRVNKEFRETLGWTNQDARRRDLIEACYPDTEYRQEVMDFMHSPGSEWREWKPVSKSGEQVISSWTNIRLSDETYVGLGIDLREIKEAEEKLRESESLLRNTFDSIKECVILVNPKERTIIECNMAAEQVFGYSKEELISKSTRVLHVNEEKFREFGRASEKNLENEDAYRAEFTMRKKNGEVINTDHTVTLVRDKEGTVDCVVSVIRDVTDQKNIVQTIIETEDRERRRFARELHDGLGQYLVSVHMNLESVKADAKDLPERKRRHFNTGLHLLKEAISETRTLAQNLMPRAIEDYGLVLAVETQLEHILETTEISYSFRYDLDDGKLALSAQLHMYRIIQEAVINAVKYAKCSEISIQMYEQNELILVTVEDNGIGIDRDELEEECGLGLKSMESRAKALSGALDVDSRPGKGTAIYLEAPLAPNLKDQING